MSRRSGRVDDAPPLAPSGLGAVRDAQRNVNHDWGGTASNVRYGRANAGTCRCGSGLVEHGAGHADPFRRRSRILTQADDNQRDRVDSSADPRWSVPDARLAMSRRVRLTGAGLAWGEAEFSQIMVGRERQNVICLAVKPPYGTAALRGGITRAEGRASVSTVAGARAMIA